MSSESLSFKEWLRTEGLITSGNISEFKDTTIAIDAEDYLISLLCGPSTKEPLLPALGGLPFALRSLVETDLGNFKEAGIKPFFVFNGLDLACRDRRSLGREAQRASTILNEAWKLYDEGKGAEAVQSFGKACTYRTSHILRRLHFDLHKRGVRTLVAPYNAAAQAVRLEQEDYVDAVAGSASCLVFGAEKVILSFNWETKKVTWVTLKQVLHKLMLNHDQFVDLCLLSGSSILPTMPEIDTDAASSKMVAARAVMSRANQDGHTACLQAKDDHYLALFRKAKIDVKHMIVVLGSGDVKQLIFDESPSDLHDAVGQHLPEELMGYFTRGLIGSRVLNWRTRQELYETPPLDGGNSAEYRNLVLEKLRPLRTRSLAILTRSLHRYFQKQDVEMVCWFNENDKRSLGVPELPLQDITRDAETWHVKDALVEQSAEADIAQKTERPIQYAIAVLSDDSFAKKTVTRRKDGEHSVLKSQTELLANTTWRFLQDRGYVNNDHTLSSWGKALKAAFEQATKSRYLGSTDPVNEGEEAIFVAFELVRLDLLNNKHMFSPPLSGGPIRGTEADKGFTMLFSRIASLGTVSHNQIGYTGPLSRHCLAYHQVVATVRNSLRDLVEMHAANMMLSASAVRQDLREYLDVGAALPFGKEPDCGLALVVKCYLDELSNEHKKTSIKPWFNHCPNIDGDLVRVWNMWDAINAGIQAADSAIVTSDVKNMFQNADAWLQKKLQSAASTNGA